MAQAAGEHLQMENIFYAALALHIAGKPTNKENIRAVLKAAATPFDESALDAMAAFVESLEAARRKTEKTVDPRIIKFLSSELAQRKVQTKQLQAVLEELTSSIPSAPQGNEAALPETAESVTGEEIPPASQKVHRQETAKVDTRAAAEAQVGQSDTTAEAKGRYVYGIAAGGEALRLGPIGIESSEVYTIPYRDLCALVHNCPTEPYQSSNDGIVKGWVRTHQSVLDGAKERFGTIIPLGFDTILQSKGDSISPDQVVRDWLKEDYDRLCTMMQKIRGRDEYGVQVSYEPGVIGKQISQQNEEVRKVSEEMATKSPGMAYMYRQKLEKVVKAEMERLADNWFTDFYGRIKKHADDIVVEKTKKMHKDRVMLLNLSCLVAKDNIGALGEELERINNMEGFSVRFTGPWPPYSFVAKPAVSAEEE
jgi:hypothetical protein